jgi:hypothetical protein
MACGEASAPVVARLSGTYEHGHRSSMNVHELWIRRPQPATIGGPRVRGNCPHDAATLKAVPIYKVTAPVWHRSILNPPHDG